MELIKVLPPIEPGSVILLRMDSPTALTAKILKEGLKTHYGHADFLVVILGLHEDLDVIPPQELSGWIQSRKGYFGGTGGHYLEES